MENVSTPNVYFVHLALAKELKSKTIFEIDSISVQDSYCICNMRLDFKIYLVLFNKWIAIHHHRHRQL